MRTEIDHLVSRGTQFGDQFFLQPKPTVIGGDSNPHSSCPPVDSLLARVGARLGKAEGKLPAPHGPDVSSLMALGWATFEAVDGSSFWCSPLIDTTGCRFSLCAASLLQPDLSKRGHAPPIGSPARPGSASRAFPVHRESVPPSNHQSRQRRSCQPAPGAPW